MSYRSKLATEQIIKAWTNRRFRESLSDEQKLELLESPIGAVLVDLRGRDDTSGPDDDTCALQSSFCVIISETFGTTCPAPKDDDARSSGGQIAGFAVQYGTFWCPSE
jgi:hypothetical protein